MLTLFQYWFSRGCARGWQQFRGHRGPCGVESASARNRTALLRPGENRGCFAKLPHTAQRKVAANLPSGLWASIKGFVGLSVRRRGFVWPCGQGTEGEQRGAPGASHGVFGRCIRSSTPSPSWGAPDRRWSRAPNSKRGMKTGSSVVPLTQVKSAQPLTMR